MDGSLFAFTAAQQFVFSILLLEFLLKKEEEIAAAPRLDDFDKSGIFVEAKNYVNQRKETNMVLVTAGQLFKIWSYLKRGYWEIPCPLDNHQIEILASMPAVLERL